MSKLDLMKDPFFAQLMHVVENVICKADSDAEKMGLRLTDSNIKSALNKARRVTPDKAGIPVKPLETREDIIEELALSIAANRELLAEETNSEDGTERSELSLADWNNAIMAVEASLKVRRSNEPGSRFYLDFLRRFIEQGKL